MTAREWMRVHHPEEVSEDWTGGVSRCPGDYPELNLANRVSDFTCLFPNEVCTNERCTQCWDREIPGTSACEESLECCGISVDESRLSPDGVEGSSLNYPAELSRLQDIIQEQREKIRRLDGIIRNKNSLIDEYRASIAKYEVIIRTVEAVTGKKIVFD